LGDLGDGEAGVALKEFEEAEIDGVEFDGQSFLLTPKARDNFPHIGLVFTQSQDLWHGGERKNPQSMGEPDAASRFSNAE
jgi:hypothetical protein